MRILGVLVLAAGLAGAQPDGLTLEQAVEGALRNYPALRVPEEQARAAAAGIQLARTAYLPRVDATAQANRATRNNTFGMLLPQSVIPSISGPVLGTNNLGTVWGSAVGVLVSWEPFDFGLRRATVAAAGAIEAQYQAARKRTEFEVAVATADAYLTLAAAGETAKAARAAVDRAAVVKQATEAQSSAGLRPGADAARAEAELAAARTQLAQAERAEGVARAALGQYTGGSPTGLRLRARAFRELPPEEKPGEPAAAGNPIAAEQAAAVEQARAQLRALARAYFPRFYLQGAAYARGTGAETNGARLGNGNGLAPSVQNYAVGLTVNFPVMEFAANRAREAAQSANVRAQEARGRQIATEIQAQWNAAVANLDGARRVAGNTPVGVKAARSALEQATARYRSGLGNITEVADGQRLLTQAEIDDALARLGVWRGLLGVAAAAGDIRPFVAEASR